MVETQPGENRPSLAEHRDLRSLGLREKPKAYVGNRGVSGMGKCPYHEIHPRQVAQATKLLKRDRTRSRHCHRLILWSIDDNNEQ